MAPKQIELINDYPRRPRIEDCQAEIRIVFADVEIVATRQSKRVVEAGHAPVYYLPTDAIRSALLAPTSRQSICEWKGAARHFHVTVGKYTAEFGAWSYLQTEPAYSEITDWVAFHAHLMDGCYIDGERVQAEPGNVFGGWITDEIQGEFKRFD